MRVMLQPHSEPLAGLERDPLSYSKASAELRILCRSPGHRTERNFLGPAGPFVTPNKTSEARGRGYSTEGERAVWEDYFYPAQIPGHFLSSEGYFYLTAGHECCLPG